MGACRERAKELIAQHGAQMSGRSNAFRMRVDRGWAIKNAASHPRRRQLHPERLWC
jgi:hypothetical protein